MNKSCANGANIAEHLVVDYYSNKNVAINTNSDIENAISQLMSQCDYSVKFISVFFSCFYK